MSFLDMKQWIHNSKQLRLCCYLAWIICLVLPFYGPRWMLGLVRFPNDLYIHYNWATFFSNRLSAGCLQPEWLPELFNGLGGGVFCYYPPGYFYLVSLVQFITHDMWLSMRWVEAGAVASLGCMTLNYLNAHRKTVLGGDRYLVVCALCCAPFWIANLSLGGGLPSFISSVLMLYALIRCERLLEPHGRHFDWRLAMSVGLMPWFHNLTLIMTICAVFGGLTFHVMTRKKVNWKIIVLSIVVGVLLGSGRTLAASLQSGGINMENLLHHVELDWRANFILPIGLKTTWFLYQWPIGGLLILGALVMGVAWIGRGSYGPPGSLAYWLGATTFPLVFASQLSWPVWALCRPLQYFQFPTRFLQPASLAVVMGLACVISETTFKPNARWLRIIARLALSGGLVLSSLLSVITWRDGESVWIKKSKFLERTCEQKEYLPFGEPSGWKRIPSVMPGQTIELDGAMIDVKDPNLFGGLRAVVHNSIESHQLLPILAHPRWRLMIDGKQTNWLRDEDSGLVRTYLPKGESCIEMVWHRGFSYWMSLAGLAILCVGVPLCGWVKHLRDEAIDSKERS